MPSVRGSGRIAKEVQYEAGLELASMVEVLIPAAFNAQPKNRKVNFRLSVVRINEDGGKDRVGFAGFIKLRVLHLSGIDGRPGKYILTGTVAEIDRQAERYTGLALDDKIVGELWIDNYPYIWFRKGK